MSSEKKIVTLKTSDGKTFEVEVSAIIQSRLIKHLIEKEGGDNEFVEIPSNINSNTLSKVIEYCENNHSKPEIIDVDDDDDDVDEKQKQEEIEKKKKENWEEKEFMNKMDRKSLLELFSAASELDIESLLVLTVQKIEQVTKNLSVEQIRMFLNV